ncbi:MAG: stage III sporulation protein AB, partial [Clostridia bacterium]|nr:stage III sporulation protein AB [Clostridia bacterium]
CPKAEAAMILLRAMAPQVLAMDEITAPGDVAAILCAANCGVAVVATAHADSVETLADRRIYAPLWENRVFSRVLELSVQNGKRTCAVYAIEA